MSTKNHFPEVHPMTVPIPLEDMTLRQLRRAASARSGFRGDIAECGKINFYHPFLKAAQNHD
jgi:hypothetical protein